MVFAFVSVLVVAIDDIIVVIIEVVITFFKDAIGHIVEAMLLAPKIADTAVS